MSARAEPATLYVHGAGHFHPENVIDNEFLSSLNIDTHPTWIVDRVGIRTRRTVLDLSYIRETRNRDPLQAASNSKYNNAQTAAAAARMALERAGITADKIGLVIMGGCSPQYLIPAEACLLAAELGIEAPCYDMNSACSSFAFILHSLRSMRADAAPEYILVAHAENTTRQIDYNDRSSAVLWGDGSAAVVLSLKHPAPISVQDTVIYTDPTGWDQVVIKQGGHFAQNGSHVQSFAIRKSLAMIEQLGAAHPKSYFIGHQANLLMLQSVCIRAGIPPDRHWFNVDQFGNCGAAGAPSVLSQSWDRCSSGDSIIMATVGSGLSWGGLALRKD